MIGPHQYRKRPVVIEAALWDGGPEDATLIIDWVLESGGTARYHEEMYEVAIVPEYAPPPPVVVIPEHIAIDTLEGTMKASVGDFVIRGMAGEFYPCKPAIFAGSYERVEE